MLGSMVDNIAPMYKFDTRFWPRYSLPVEIKYQISGLLQKNNQCLRNKGQSSEISNCRPTANLQKIFEKLILLRILEIQD
jgi:hypothetical protein